MSDSSQRDDRRFVLQPEALGGQNFRLVDEIRRCPPGIACALLEVMQAGRVMVGDRSIQMCTGSLALSGTGLLPVPSPAELVERARGKFDQTADNGADKCCGCGGCDKQNL